MSKRLKKLMAGEVQKGVGTAEACVVLSYKRLDGDTSQRLRAALRKDRVDLSVMRNRVAAKALVGSKVDKVSSLLKGPTAVATGGEDAIALARAVVEGIKSVTPDPKLKNVEVRGGVMDGRVVTGDEIAVLAKLPGRKELLSMIAATVVQPMANVAYGVDAILSGVARAVEALREQKEKGTAA
jgi:large subunit ribosomal protein L10